MSVVQFFLSPRTSETLALEDVQSVPRRVSASLNYSKMINGRIIMLFAMTLSLFARFCIFVVTWSQSLKKSEHPRILGAVEVCLELPVVPNSSIGFLVYLGTSNLFRNACRSVLFKTVGSFSPRSRSANEKEGRCLQLSEDRSLRSVDRLSKPSLTRNSKFEVFSDSCPVISSLRSNPIRSQIQTSSIPNIVKTHIKSED